MRQLTYLLLFAVLTPCHAYATVGTPAPGSFSYAGSFAGDDDKREFFFSLAQCEMTSQVVSPSLRSAWLKCRRGYLKSLSRLLHTGWSETASGSLRWIARPLNHFLTF